MGPIGLELLGGNGLGSPLSFQLGLLLFVNFAQLFTGDRVKGVVFFDRLEIK